MYTNTFLILSYFRFSNCHIHLHLGMTLVSLNFNVFNLEVLDVFHFAIKFDLGERLGLPFQLLLQRLNVVLVNVSVALTKKQQ